MLFLCCSAGKSFVAEILMLRRVLSTGKMALLVLPYVSICAEKVSSIEYLCLDITLLGGPGLMYGCVQAGHLEALLEPCFQME